MWTESQRGCSLASLRWVETNSINNDSVAGADGRLAQLLVREAPGLSLLRLSYLLAGCPSVSLNPLYLLSTGLNPETEEETERVEDSPALSLPDPACFVIYCSLGASVLECLRGETRTMPGVNLDLAPASEAPAESLGTPDSLCAESGLEAVIGDLLAQEVDEEEEAEVGVGEEEEGAPEGRDALSAMELTLRCAVGEVHSDLQAFGKRVDARLEEAAARVVPLATAVEELQEENLRLRTQQERLARQVEALCQALGLPEPVAGTSPAVVAPVAPVTPVSPVPHPPTFSTRRSYSSPSLMGGLSRSNSLMETEPVMAVEPSALTSSKAPAVPNGSSEARARAEECAAGKLTAEQLAAIEDEEVLDKMLDESKDFEERKMIRAAMRELRKRKREALLGFTQDEIDQRERERESRLQDLRQQREARSQKGRPGGGAMEVVTKKSEKSADGSTLSQLTKTDRFAQSEGTVQTKSYSFSSSSSSSSSKKVGSVFDREDDSSRSGGGLAALERRQAERRKELMRAQTLPKTSAMQARRAMIEKLETTSGGPGNPAVARVNKVQRSTSFGVPNANSIKQMLLDWCRAKTRSYENVDIQNFSSSWSDGMAFCALLADCPQLLDVEDMVRMREPDWKCVYTYLQEFYRGLVQKGLSNPLAPGKNPAEWAFANCMPLLEVEDMMIMGKKPDSKCVFTYVQSLVNHLRRYEMTCRAFSDL
ncbi:hypothetical protein JZ751_001627 [Albula glossodonta]|uniref:Calponin-homology (CH) domain-containing protein n=1 Tax=Albula glossodonta TaxID=121402 RepID=A0A8T2PUB3_9TELE|nr:hypothetical protein JZ751_001627 [Albula glossodonta]